MQIRIDKLANGGFGLGRGPDGRVWLVPFAAPGDLLEVAVARDRGRHVEGDVTAVLEPGPGRVEPRCPVYQRCGGCQLQHVSHAAQVEAKAGVIAEAFHRIARLEAPAPEVVSDAPWGWRARIDLHAMHGRLGFFARGTRSLVEPDACPIARPALSALIPILRRAVRDAGPGQFDVEAVESADGAVVLVARCRPAEANWLADRLSEVPGVAGVDAGSGHARQVRGNVRVRWPTLGPSGAPATVEQDARGFTQANAGLNPRLVATVVDLAAPAPGRRLLELYAGAGNLTVPMAAGGADVTAVEVDVGALADAAATTGGRVRTMAGDVGAVAARLAGSGERFDLVVADPPRTGFGPGIAAGIARLAAGADPRVVICSCDPATLARDTAAITAESATLGTRRRVQRVVVVDMFPQTWHVETVVLLARED